MVNQNAFDQARDKSAFLLEKWQYWTPNQITQFYNNMVNIVPDTIAVELLENGYISVSQNYIDYTNLTTGDHSRITKDWTDKDVFASLKLYEKSQELNTFRVDRLTYYKLVEFQDSRCLYSEFKSPNSQYGASWSEKIGTRSYTAEESITNIRTGIDQFKVLLTVAKQVSAELMCGLPKNLFDPGNQYQDDLGMFYSGIYKWDTNLDAVIKLGLEFVNRTIYLTFKNNPISDSIKTELLNYAETIWNLE
jgi:hypothetical protein